MPDLNATSARLARLVLGLNPVHRRSATTAEHADTMHAMHAMHAMRLVFVPVLPAPARAWL